MCPDAGPDCRVYYNEALACTFHSFHWQWFAPRYPKLNVPENGRQFLSVGDYECSFGYLVLYCCALHLGIQDAPFVVQTRTISNTCFGLDAILQRCAASCPDSFGEKTELYKLFYLPANSRAKDHKAKFEAATMEAYRKMCTEHA